LAYGFFSSLFSYLKFYFLWKKTILLQAKTDVVRPQDIFDFDESRKLQNPFCPALLLRSNVKVNIFPNVFFGQVFNKKKVVFQEIRHRRFIYLDYREASVLPGVKATIKISID
jgi:hypothetical protein